MFVYTFCLVILCYVSQTCSKVDKKIRLCCLLWCLCPPKEPCMWIQGEDIDWGVVPRLPSIRILTFWPHGRCDQISLKLSSWRAASLGRAELDRLSYLPWVFRKIYFPFGLCSCTSLCNILHRGMVNWRTGIRVWTSLWNRSSQGSCSTCFVLRLDSGMLVNV